MRRRDRLIDDREEIDAIIRGSDVCRLALAMGNIPYLVPLSFGYDGDAIYVHTAHVGKKIDYFEANALVCFEFERNVSFVRDASGACESTFAFESVIGYGTMTELVDTERKVYALSQITRQYAEPHSAFDRATMDRVRTWRITIDSVTGKRSPGKTSR